MRERRILLSIDGPLHNVLKIKPPLVISEDSARTFLSAFADTLESLT